jgi:predicted membrane metal-binding protein
MTTATRSPAEMLDDNVSVAGLAVGTGLRAIEFGPLVLLGLLICPPLAILAVLVVVPIVVMGLVFGLLALVVATPYLLFQSVRGHHHHAALLAHRLRTAGHAVLDVAPHRIVADARQARS